MAETDASPTSRAADARYAAPRLARSVHVVGAGAQVDRRRAELSAAGVLVDPDDAELLLSAPQHWRERADHSPVTVVLDPSLEPRSAVRTAVSVLRARRRLRRARYTVHDLLALRSEGAVRCLVPLGQPVALTYATRWLMHPARGAGRLRSAGLRSWVGRRLLALSSHSTIVASRSGGGPALLDVIPRADRGAGGWILLLSPGDELTRVVLLSLDAAGHPLAAAKTARSPAARAAFDAEGRALAVAATSGVPGIPQVLARGEIHGLPVLVERAMPGELLARAIEGTGTQHGLSTLDRAAAWAIQLGSRTLRPPAALTSERLRLSDDLAASWPRAAVDLLHELPAVPGVLAHNDLGTWNVLVTDGDVSAVDWESATDPGWPLWDLLYLLTDGLGIIDGARGHDARADHALALHRGDLDASPWFFARLRDGAAALRIPGDAVGALATLCWLHHGLSRRDRASRGVGAGTAPVPAAGRLGDTWLSDPRLGRQWPAYQAARP